MSYASDALIDALQRDNNELTDENQALERQIDGLYAEIEQLKGENTKMRERMTRMELHECPDCANAADLQEALSDNAKLRELAKQMYPKAKAFLQIGVGLGCNDSLSYDWYFQLRELGVKVKA